jgi:glutathione S-transferase
MINRSKLRLVNLNCGTMVRLISSKPTLYGFPTSQPYRAVAMFCKENKIDFHYVEINVFKGQHKKADFLQVNPFGYIPAWQEADMGFSVGESAAILQYLADSRGLQKYYPKDYKDRAVVDSWLHWNHGNTRLGTKAILHLKLYGKPGTEERLANGTAVYTQAIQHLNSHFASSRFVTGGNLTIADFLIVPEIDQLGNPGFNFFDFTPYPHIQRYLADFKSNVLSYDESFKAVVDTAVKLAARRQASKV